MELGYSIQPGWFQKWKPAIQNWRLLVFVALIGIPSAWIGYTVYDQMQSHGIRVNGSIVEVDLKPLGNFPFSERDGKITDVPRHYRELDGKRVQLSGKMFGGKSVYEASRFEFVYDINLCCLGGPPRVHEPVFVQVPRGEKVPIYGGQMIATGILHVRLQRDDLGTIVSVYDMELDSLRAAS